MRGLIKTIGIVVVAALLFLTLCPANYAGALMTTPSEISYAELEETIDTYIGERKEGTASVSISVFEHDTTLHTKQYGFADVENQIQVDADTVYEWGSVSKLFVWVSVMQLWEQERLSLDEDIRVYLPDGFLSKLQCDKPITMTDVMNHRGGWQETTYAIEFRNADRLTSLEDALRHTQPPQVYEPDTITAYSNWGAALAAYIVERVSGMDYAEYVHQHILEPLSMRHTAIKGDWSDNEWVKAQRERIKTYEIYSDSFSSYGVNLSYINLYPAGSVTGTLDDFVKFAKAFVPAGGEKSPLFTKDETLSVFLSPTSYYSGMETARNCHGLWTMEYAVTVLGHGGNTNGFSTMLAFDPQSGIGIVVMTNELGETAYNYGLLSLVFGHREPDPIAEESLDISGIYLSNRTFETGFTRIYKYIGGIMPITNTDDADTFNMPGGITAARISDSMYLTDNGNGMEAVFNVVSDPDGKLIIENYTTDYTRINTVKIILIWGLLIAALAAWVYAFVSAIVWIIAFVRRKQKGAPAKMQLSALIATIVNTALMLFLWVSFDRMRYEIIVPICILIALLSLVPLANIAFMIGKWKTLQHKVWYSITASVCAISTLCAVFFQAFIFWI